MFVEKFFRKCLQTLSNTSAMLPKKEPFLHFFFMKMSRLNPLGGGTPPSPLKLEA